MKRRTFIQGMAATPLALALPKTVPAAVADDAPLDIAAVYSLSGTFANVGALMNDGASAVMTPLTMRRTSARSSPEFAPNTASRITSSVRPCARSIITTVAPAVRACASRLLPHPRPPHPTSTFVTTRTPLFDEVGSRDEAADLG